MNAQEQRELFALMKQDQDRLEEVIREMKREWCLAIGTVFHEYQVATNARGQRK